MNPPTPVTITPLARRPWRMFWVIASLLGTGVVASLLNVLRNSKPIPRGDLWVFLFPAAFLSLLYLNMVTLSVADYDADFLYLFKKTGTEQIPLGRFYKLNAAGRGRWHLKYRDEQGFLKKLEIQPVRVLPFISGLLRPEDDTSIHGFIDAVWQHNPQLDVSHW